MSGLILPHNGLIRGGGVAGPEFTYIGGVKSTSGNSITLSSAVVPAGDVYVAVFNGNGRSVTGLTVGASNAVELFEDAGDGTALYGLSGFAGGTVDITATFIFSISSAAMAIISLAPGLGNEED